MPVCIHTQVYINAYPGIYFIPVNLSDPYGKRSPATENEKAGGLGSKQWWQLHWRKNKL